MKKLIPRFLSVLILTASISSQSSAQDHSVARIWNEQLLEAIRGDFARPTVHARNLFHVSTAMYDAWAVFDALAGWYCINPLFTCFKNKK